MAEASQLKSVSIKRGKNAPERLLRGSAAAADGKCYFMSCNDPKIRVYDAEKDDWLALRPSLYKNVGLAVINGLVTTIGGQTTDPVRLNRPTSYIVCPTEGGQRSSQT